MIQVLEELQKNGIGFTIKSGKDVEVKVSDYDSINLAIVGLARKAVEKFPDGEFAKYFNKVSKYW